MKHKLFKWLSVGCLAIGLSACSSQNDTKDAANNTQERIYRVATNAAFAPFESIDAKKQIVGFDVDVLNAMAKEAGIKIEFVDVPWEGIFSMLKNGDADIVASGVTITDERKKEMAFTNPYFEAKQVIAVVGDKNIKTPEDLQTVNRVGVGTGMTGDIIAQKILGKTSQKIVRLESLPLVMKEVESGGLDAAIGDNGVVANYVKFNSDKGLRVIDAEGFETEYYGFAIRPDDTALQQKLNEGLKAIKANGEYDKIYATYFAN